MTMFAVMGATGQVGRAVANSLIDQGREVRVIVRSKSKARPWAARGADVVSRRSKISKRWQRR